MPLLLTNVTLSNVEVPRNFRAKQVYPTISPGGRVMVSNEYVEQLTDEARARLARVCSDPDPIFSVEVLESNPPWEGGSDASSPVPG
jgi:hypothetical protein